MVKEFAGFSVSEKTFVCGWMAQEGLSVDRGHPERSVDVLSEFHGDVPTGF